MREKKTRSNLLGKNSRILERKGYDAQQQGNKETKAKYAVQYVRRD